MELRLLYSNHHSEAMQLRQLNGNALSHHRSHPEPDGLVPQRVVRRLGAERIGQIVADYASGISTTQLAKGHGIGKGTLLRLLRERGVAIRHQRGASRRV